MKRGDVWLVALEPVRGHEISKTRPCLVVSPPEIHDRLGTVIIAPMTTGSRPAPFRVGIRFQDKDGLVVLDQMRSVDKSRLIRRLGSANGLALTQTLARLRDMFED